jgi:hypothetical protein
MLAGCAADTVAPTATDSELAASFEMMAAEATRDGDTDAADAFGGGALALRAGVTPSEITVLIDGAEVTHKAIVFAVARGGPSGPQVLMRSLLAWSGTNPRETILKVMLLADEAEFGHPSQMVPQGRARGWFADLVEQVRYLATSGSAGIQVAEVGGPCGRAAPDRPGIRCHKARFDIQVDGEFQHRTQGDVAEASLAISAAATGVAGIIVAPPGFGGTP